MKLIMVDPSSTGERSTAKKTNQIESNALNDNS